MNNSAITINEFKNILKYVVSNNKNLIDKGLTPITLGIEGPAGLGKTFSVRQVAEELGMTFCQVNLAELVDPGDLCGFPFKEFEVVEKQPIYNNDGTVVLGEDGKPAMQDVVRWIPSDLIKATDCDMVTTGNSRMSYATPGWLPREENPNGVIIFLDDYSR